MAHNLAVIDGKTAMFAATGKHGLPWHKLGQFVQDAQTWQEAIKLAKLDWDVKKQPLFAGHAGTWEQLPAWGIFRETDNQFFGTVGNQYEPIQNRMAFDFVDSLIGENGAHYESAGALGNGSKIFCLARVPFDFSIDGTDDKHETYLLFTSSHDGSGSAVSMLTDVRVVCQNTLQAALSRKDASGVMRVKHTKEAKHKLEAAKKLMNGVQATAKDIRDKMNELAQRRMTKTSFVETLDKIFPGDSDSKKRETVLERVAALYMDNDGNAIPEIKGTAYALLNSVTNYADHHRAVKLTASRAGYTEESARAENAMIGTADALKRDALEIILASTAQNPRQEVRKASVAVLDVPESDPVPYDANAAKSLIDSIIDQTQGS